jgi:hypothetical protein
VGLLLLRLAVGANRRRGRRVQEDDRRIMIDIGLASTIIDLFSIRRKLAASPRCVRPCVQFRALHRWITLQATTRRALLLLHACMNLLLFVHV